MASEFTLESLKDFMIQNGGRVKNHELVTHFKSFLNDPTRKDEMRDKFKNYVNTIATIKVDEQNDKILVLKKKYRPDSGGGGNKEDYRAQSEPPVVQNVIQDKPDGASMSSGYSEGNLTAADLRLSQSTLSSVADTTSLNSGTSTSSLSSANPEEDQNMSVVSVKERAKHLNRMESQSDIQKETASPLSATRKKDVKKGKTWEDSEESSSGSGYVSLEPIEKEWLVTCSAADYHPMHQLLSKHPQLAKVKDFASGHTALHWAAKHGRSEVIKMLVGNPGVYVNQRTNGGYTALHLAAMHGHENIIELLVNVYKADPNIRDYSGKKPKQYLKNSAASRVQHLLVSSRISSKQNQEKIENNFMRNTAGRRSNRTSAIKSLIQASSSAMRQTVMRSSYGSNDDLTGEKVVRRSPSISPRHSAESSPVVRRKGSFGKDREMMPPPSGPVKQRKPQYSISKESLCSDDRKLSAVRQVPRSESEPNLGESTQPSRQSFI